MILGGGVLRSGGQTKYVMVIDAVGTWCFGVPLGLLTAFVLGVEHSVCLLHALAGRVRALRPVACGAAAQKVDVCAACLKGMLQN